MFVKNVSVKLILPHVIFPTYLAVLKELKFFKCLLIYLQ